MNYLVTINRYLKYDINSSFFHFIIYLIIVIFNIIVWKIFYIITILIFIFWELGEYRSTINTLKLVSGQFCGNLLNFQNTKNKKRKNGQNHKERPSNSPVKLIFLQPQHLSNAPRKLLKCYRNTLKTFKPTFFCE